MNEEKLYPCKVRIGKKGKAVLLPKVSKGKDQTKLIEDIVKKVRGKNG